MVLVDGKPWHGADELVGTPGMPKRSDEINARWGKDKPRKTRKELGLSGKGWMYPRSCLPPETQDYLDAEDDRQAAQSLTAAPAGDTAPAPKNDKAVAPAASSERNQFTHQQCLVADMRLRVLKEIERLMAQKSLEWAIRQFNEAAKAGTLREGLARAAVIAHDRNNVEVQVVIGSDGYLQPQFPEDYVIEPEHCVIAARTIKRWRAAYQKDKWVGLVPLKPQKDLSVKCWHDLAFALKKRPQGSVIRWIHEQILAQWDAAWPEDEKPSYDVVCTLFRDKASQGDLLKGRWSGQQLRAKQYYVERTTEGLLPFDEVHADGWTTHFTAPHPVTGEYVTYEVWDFHDVATGYVPPFGLGLKECFEVILKGIENCVREGGMIGHLQTDSTKIVKNSARFKGDFVAALEQRIGCTIVHPKVVGNAQANGIAENFHSWMDKRCRELATYQGKNMDRMTHKRVKKLTDQAVKAKNAGELAEYDRLVREAAKAGKGLVFKSREEACEWLEKQRRIWNTTPCRNHPKIRDPETGKLRHMSRLERLNEFKAKGWIPLWLGGEASHEAHLIDVFRPHVQVKVFRGTVKPYGSMRFRHEDLDHWEGKPVVVAYDPWDWRQVWVKDLKGEAICVAEYADATGYRAKTAQEAADEKRATAQIRLLKQKEAAIQARTPGLLLEQTGGNVIEMQRVELPANDEAEALPLRRVDLPAETEAAEPQRSYMDTMMLLWGENSEEALEDEAAAR